MHTNGIESGVEPQSLKIEPQSVKVEPQSLKVEPQSLDSMTQHKSKPLNDKP